VPEGPGADVIVSRSQVSPGLALVTIEGEVDLTNADEVRGVIVDAIGEWQPKEIQVNLAAVPFMDSLGISALIAGYRAAVASGTVFRVVEPSRPLVSLLEITGLLEVFGYDSSSSIAR
jgi:anti-sigma B factor antagonist